MDSKLLTVVVPVYKVEPYIHKCLDSLIIPEPLMEKLEVLAIDDGTPDRSAEMAEEYGKQYPRTFRIIHQKNGGHGSAWNRGLAEAAGKYIRFLDSDDWFSTGDFGRLMEKLEQLDVDIVISNYNRYFVQRDEFQPMRDITLEEGKCYDADELDWTKLPWEVTYFWRCTYRTAMLRAEQPLFLERVFYDDAKLFFASAILARSVCYLDLTIYNYLLGREGQTMTAENQKRHYLNKYAVQKDIFDFYLSHPATGVARNQFLGKQINFWLFDQFYQLSRFPYQERKRLLKEWQVYYQKLADKTGFPKAKYGMMRCYFLLPYPLYHGLSQLKGLMTKGKKGRSEYVSWGQ